jgi:prolyl 4-hydroxylase
MAGECEKNPTYMQLTCAPSCQTCDKLSFDVRCPYDKKAPKIWKPGDLNKLFERLTTDPAYQQYTPTTLSSPKTGGPWVITMDNVTSEEECERLIQLGNQVGYERSKDVGQKNFDGTFGGKESLGRTSSNAWCTDACYQDALTQAVLLRMENITGIPENNSEFLQLLKYEETQFYGSHHE